MTPAADKRRLFFDVESVAIENAADYLESISAPSNYKDPEKIAAYIEQAKADQIDKAALDVDLGRLVAIGAQVDDACPEVRIIQSEDDERDALDWFWSLVRPFPYPRLIGYNVCGFDLPLLMRRSLYLGVRFPPIGVGRYRHQEVDDLMLLLSFDGALKFRGLDFYCARFGITSQTTDPITGAEVAAAYREGRFEDIAHHCRADVERTAALALRVGM